MTLDDAKKEISSFFQSYGVQARQATQNSSKGKIYELYCVSKTVEKLKTEYGLKARFRCGRSGRTVDFRSSPGRIDGFRSYFELRTARNTFELHTDVEFLTLGSRHRAHTDRSGYHEVDIAVVGSGVRGRPSHNALAVGVECKAHAIFTKSIVKQVLGVRREMSLLWHHRRTILAVASDTKREITACPGSEYWLAYTDSLGDKYRESPAAFGIDFVNWCP